MTTKLERETGLVELIEAWPLMSQAHNLYDHFNGEVIGHYVTKEGKRGVVLQQIGTKVVHVYGAARLGSGWVFNDQQD